MLGSVNSTLDAEAALCLISNELEINMRQIRHVCIYLGVIIKADIKTTLKGGSSSHHRISL